MSDDTEPMSATVYPEGGRWWLRIWDDTGNMLSVARLSWDGSGRFYEEGLNDVVRHLPKGYAYRSSQAWGQNEDGSFSTVLHQIDPRFG